MWSPLGNRPAVAAGHPAELQRHPPPQPGRDAAGAGQIRLQRHRALLWRLEAERAGDDPVGAVRAHKGPRVVDLVARGDPVRAVRQALHAAHRLAIAELDPGLLRALDQEVVQARASRQVAEHPVEIARHRPAVEEAQLRARYHLLDHRREVEREQPGAAESDRAAARLVAREAGAVQQQHIEAAFGDLARGGATGGTGAHDHDVNLHRPQLACSLAPSPSMLRRPRPAVRRGSGQRQRDGGDERRLHHGRGDE